MRTRLRIRRIGRELLALAAWFGCVVVAVSSGPLPSPAFAAPDLQPELIAAQGFSDGVATQIGMTPTDLAWDVVGDRLLVADCEVVRAIDPDANTSTVIAINAALDNPTHVPTFAGSAHEITVRADGTILLGVDTDAGCGAISWDQVVELQPAGPATVLSGGGAVAPAVGVAPLDADWLALTDLAVADDGRIFVVDEGDIFEFAEGGALDRVDGPSGLPLRIGRDFAVDPATGHVLYASPTSLFEVDATGARTTISTDLPPATFGQPVAIGDGDDVWVGGQPSTPGESGFVVARVDRSTGTVEVIAEAPDAVSTYWWTVTVAPGGVAYTTTRGTSSAQLPNVASVVAASAGAPITTVAGQQDRWQGEGVPAARQFFGLVPDSVVFGRPDVGIGTGPLLHVLGSRLAIMDLSSGTTSTADLPPGSVWVGERPDGAEILGVPEGVGSTGLSLVQRDPVTGITADLLPSPIDAFGDYVDVGPDGTVYVASFYGTHLLTSIAPDGTVITEPLDVESSAVWTIFASSSGLFMHRADGLFERIGGAWVPVPAVCAGNGATFSPLVSLRDGRFLGTVAIDDPGNPGVSSFAWCRVDPNTAHSEVLPGPVQFPIPSNAHEAADGYVYFSGYVAGSLTGSIGIHRMAVTESLPTCDPDPAGIIGWWRGDGSLGAQVGTALSGSPAYSAGHADQGFNLTSSNSLTAEGVPQADSALTLETWVKPQANSGVVQTLISRWRGPGFTSATDDGHAYNLELHPNDQLVFQTDDLSARVPEQLRVSAPQLYDGNLHHIAATWTTSTMALYIDGVQVATRASQGGQLNTGASTPVRIGGPFGFTGVVDEPTIWTRALSTSEIASIAASAGAKCS